MNIRTRSINCRYNRKRISGKLPLSHPTPDLMRQMRTTVWLATSGNIYFRNVSNPEEFDLHGLVDQ